MAELVLTGNKEEFVKAAKSNPVTFAKYIDIDAIKSKSDDEIVKIDINAPYNMMIDLFRKTFVFVNFKMDYDLYLSGKWDDEEYEDDPYEDYYYGDYEEAYNNFPMSEKIHKL